MSERFSSEEELPEWFEPESVGADYNYVEPDPEQREDLLEELRRQGFIGGDRYKE